MKRINFSIMNGAELKKIAALIILILAFLAFIWELIVAFQSTGQINKESKPLNLVTKQESIQLNSPLFTTALFGDYVPANLSEADIKPSSLDVQVVGIMFATKEHESQVILRIGGGKEEFYLLGDKLPGGAIIKHISKEGIVVIHNGILESLSLSKNELIFDEPAKPLMKD